MNNPVSEIMSRKLLTVIPTDPLTKVQEIFNAHNIHHIPVVRYKELVGMISKTDFYKLIHGMRLRVTGTEETETQNILESHTAQDLMTKGVVRINEYDKMGVAAELFLTNYFHAVPIVNDDQELVGIVTTYDIIKHFFQKAYPNQQLDITVK